MENKPWEYSDFFANESEFLAWLRGQMRQAWSNYPVRIEFKNDMCVSVTPEMREAYGLSKQTKHAAQCVFCRVWLPKSKLEVDHTKGESTLTSIRHTEAYLDHLMCSQDNMQLACNPCHKIKTYAERYNLDFEDARAEKKVIAWIKEYNTKAQVEILILAGFSDEEVKNAGGRRKAARKMLNTKPEA